MDSIRLGNGEMMSPDVGDTDELSITSTHLASYCIYVLTKKRMQAFVLMFDYHYRVAFISRRGKQLRIIPFSQFLEPLLCPFDLTFLTIRTSEPFTNSYSVYATSKNERNELNTIITDILVSPEECKCPTVDILLYSGYIQKKGKVKWSQRWIEIQQLQIICYKKRTSQFPVNVIPITNLSIKITDPNIIILKNDVRAFHFRAETEHQRDTIYNKLVSIGVPKKNKKDKVKNPFDSQFDNCDKDNSQLGDLRKNSIKLIPAVNLISAYRPFKFSDLHRLFKDPGVDLKQRHFENNSSVSSSSLHLNHHYRLRNPSQFQQHLQQQVYKLESISFASALQKNKYSTIVKDKKQQEQGQSQSTIMEPIGDVETRKPTLARRPSVKQLIEKYNSNGPATDPSSPATPSLNSSSQIAHQRKSFILNQQNQNNINTNNVNLTTQQQTLTSTSDINNVYYQQKQQTQQNQKNQSDDKFYMDLISRMDLLNNSCDEIISWLGRNKDQLTKDTCQKLIDEFNQISGALPSIQRELNSVTQYTYVIGDVQSQYVENHGDSSDSSTRSNSICSSCSEDLSSDSEDDQIFMAESLTSVPITLNLSPFPKLRKHIVTKPHNIEDITSNLVSQRGISS